MRARRGGVAMAAQILIALFLAAAPAAAKVPIGNFQLTPSTTQAGGHPDLEIYFTLQNRQDQLLNSECDCEDAKDVTVHLPTGLIGNPHAYPLCSAVNFASNNCAVDSQVGAIEISIPISPGGNAPVIAPVFNLEAQPGQAGLLGFKLPLFGSPQFIVLSSRTGSDYGLDAKVASLWQLFPPDGVKLVLWGVPAEHSHDALRYPRGTPAALFVNICDANGNVASPTDPESFFTQCGGGVSNASNSPATPFLQNPTTCADPLGTSLDVLAYDFGTTQAASSYPATTDCDQLAFNPSLFAQPTTAQTDSPSGINLDLKAPSFESSSTPSPSEIRGTTITLPPGFTINPNAAEGKTSCSDAQAKFGTTEEAQCPEFAKVGTVEVHSPVLPGVLPGAIYIGEPQPDNRYRLFVTFDGFGVHVKLPGSVQPNRQSGQLVTTFRELPQFPFEDFDLHFFGSERGILATPTQCGTYPVSTEFEPWDGALPNQTSTQLFTLNSGPGATPCPDGARPFAPGFKAASATNTAGAHTAFSLELTRPDGEQNLTGLTATTPPGFSATLSGIPYCPDAAIAAAAEPSYSGLQEEVTPRCPAASEIGTSVAGAGAGTHPVYLPGKVYLAGPYKGAPLSLVVITPAVSGPYDLGAVVVRAALHVDPTSAQVSAVSDPLPQILEGVPLRLRSILINLDRPGFALNPTNCNPLATVARASGDEGASASFSSPFQVANCYTLPFAPRLGLKLSGTKRLQNPSLDATLTTKPGEANIARTSVTLPPSEQVDNAHIQNPCTRVQFAANNCPASSEIGFAKAETPLLAQPLEGPVYLRSSSNKLPDIVATLNGQINIVLDGHLDTFHGGIRTTFETVPDAPVAKFTLHLNGGDKGLLVNSEDLCKAPRVANVKIAGQNAKTAEQSPRIQTSCGAKSRHKRHLNRTRVVR